MNALNRKFQKLEDLRCLKTEAELRQDLHHALVTERKKQNLSGAAGVDDSEFVERLFNEGFTAETLPALVAAPIAMVAWGSGQVTSEELAMAMQAAQDLRIADNDAANSMFQTWLEKRPSASLLLLWQDYTREKAARLQADAYDPEQMLLWLKRVALASGGILGFGAICDGEQAIIDRVQQVLLRNTDADTEASTDTLGPKHDII